MLIITQFNTNEHLPRIMHIMFTFINFDRENRDKTTIENNIAIFYITHKTV